MGSDLGVRMRRASIKPISLRRFASESVSRLLMGKVAKRYIERPLLFYIRTLDSRWIFNAPNAPSSAGPAKRDRFRRLRRRRR